MSLFSNRSLLHTLTLLYQQLVFCLVAYLPGIDSLAPAATDTGSADAIHSPRLDPRIGQAQANTRNSQLARDPPAASPSESHPRSQSQFLLNPACEIHLRLASSRLDPLYNGMQTTPFFALNQLNFEPKACAWSELF